MDQPKDDKTPAINDTESVSINKENVSSSNWVIDHYYNDYQIVSIGDTINLQYKYVDGIKYYDCSELYVDGRYVVTGSNIVTPQINSFKEGECDTDEEACDVINDLFNQFGLSSYHIIPLKWNTRDNEAMIPKSKQTCMIHTTVITGDEESGEHQIQLIKKTGVE